TRRPLSNPNGNSKPTRIRPRGTEASRMRRFPTDEPEHDPYRTSSIDHLLRSGASAEALRHRLAMIDIEHAHRLAAYRSHFDPNQPRVPAGHPDGGQWTRSGANDDDARIASDVAPQNSWVPGARYAGAGRRGPPGRGGGLFGGGPGQQARLAMAQARA